MSFEKPVLITFCTSHVINDITGKQFQSRRKMNHEVRIIAFTYQIMFKLRARLFITFDIRPLRTRILSNPICD